MQNKIENKSVVGSFTLKSKNFGFIKLDDGTSIFVPRDNINGALTGDKVRAYLLKQEDRKEMIGKITEIIERNISLIPGIIKVQNGIKTFLADHYNQRNNYFIDGMNRIEPGDKIIIRPFKFLGDKIFCKVVKNLGNYQNPFVDIMTVPYAMEIPIEFSTETKKYARNLKYDQIEEKDRVDLTKKLIVTIDGDDAKDLDDSIIVEKKENNYILIVSIADVSNYVKENTAIDEDAFNRGVSVYIPGKVIPMLPHELSDNLCSLNPNTKKLTLSIEIKIDPSGNIIKSTPYKSFIHSKYRLTYDEVNAFYHKPHIPLKGDKELSKMLLNAQDLYNLLKAKKTKEGMINIETNEAKIVLDKYGKVVDIKQRNRDISEMLIEQFMILANEAIAKILSTQKFYSIYRIHEQPGQQKIGNFLQLKKVLTDDKSKPEIKHLSHEDLNALNDKLAKKPHHTIFQSLILRCMEKARYDWKNKGHYGLASEYYTHFTSPIRRYPDLVVHRLLKYYLAKRDTNIFANNLESMKNICEKCNTYEMRSTECEWKTKEIKICEYMNKYKFNKFKGIITTITKFGLFIEIQEFVQGLVHISTLLDDAYTYDEENMKLVGSKPENYYVIGQEIEVEILRISKPEGKILLIFSKNKAQYDANNTYERQNKQNKYKNRKNY